MDYENLIDLSLDQIENMIFDDNMFPNDESLEYLDVYLKTNFTENIITINKSNLLKLGKVIVNALSFLLITELKNVETYKTRWMLLSDFCAEYLSSKSAFSVYQDIIKDSIIENNKSEIYKIINFLYKKKVATISEISVEIEKQDEYIFNLIRKLEIYGAITKSLMGKNNIIRLNSIGLAIYNMFTKDNDMSLTWKEIESINFPETELIELDSMIIEEINEDNSDSWN